MAKKTKKSQVVDGKNDTSKEESVQEQNVVVKRNITGTKYNVRSIDELLGYTHNPYSVGNVEEYERKLKNMTLSDLQVHATELGLLPITNQKVLISRLVEQYNKTARGYYNTKQLNVIEPKNKEKLLEILKRGR